MVFLVVVAVVWSGAIAALVVLFMGRDRLLAEEAAGRGGAPAFAVLAQRTERPVVAARYDESGTTRHAEVPDPAVSTAS